MALSLCLPACVSTTGESGGQSHYDPSRPPLVKGQCAHIQDVYCGQGNSGNYHLYIRVLDSLGAPLYQFTVKSLKRPYNILSNVGYFTTDQNGVAKISFQGCDSLELANLSVLNGQVCRIATANLPDTIVLTLSVTLEKFIPTTL